MSNRYSYALIDKIKEINEKHIDLCYVFLILKNTCRYDIFAVHGNL